MPDHEAKPSPPAVAPSLVEVIAFERKYPGWGPAKIDVIRAELGITEVRYAVLLERAIADESAAQSDPVFVRNLREQRARPYRGRAPLLR